MAKKLQEQQLSEQDERLNALWLDIKEKLDGGLQERRSFEGQWVVNLAFLAGRQYTRFNSTTHTLNTLKNPKGKRRRVDNQIVSRWKRQVADYIKNRPQFSVVPSTSEDEDIEAARVATKAFDNFYRINNMRKKLRLNGGWVFSCGNCFLDDRWNPRLGPTELGEDGKLIYLGDADCGVWSPFEIVVPSAFAGDTSLHSFPWLIKMKWRELEWIKSNYDKGGLVASESQTSPVFNISGLFNGTTGEMNPSKEDGAYVIEFYKKPDSEDKKGLFITSANGIILEEDTWPFDHYAIEQFKDIDIPGVFWGKATMEDAIPLQVRWNVTINSIDEFNRTMGKGKWLVPKGSGFTVLPDDSHGEIIQYVPVMGHTPQQLTLKGLPNSFTLTLQTIQDSMDNLFSQHEVSRGTNKSDIRSGHMVALLQEQDSYGKIPSHMVFEESFEAVGRRILKRIQAGYTTERMIKVVGRDGEYEITSFKGADLRNNTDLSVKTQSSLPDSRIARQAMIMERFKEGLYGDPRQNPEVLREVGNRLDDAMIEGLYEGTRKDEAVARWENKLLMVGKDVPINAYDNHGAHLREHDMARKEMDYQKLKLGKPEVFERLEQIFIRHTMGHQEGLKMQQEAMMQQQMMMQERMKMTRGGGDKK